MLSPTPIHPLEQLGGCQRHAWGHAGHVVHGPPATLLPLRPSPPLPCHPLPQDGCFPHQRPTAWQWTSAARLPAGPRGVRRGCLGGLCPFPRPPPHRGHPHTGWMLPVLGGTGCLLAHGHASRVWPMEVGSFATDAGLSAGHPVGWQLCFGVLYICIYIKDSAFIQSHPEGPNSGSSCFTEHPLCCRLACLEGRFYFSYRISGGYRSLPSGPFCSFPACRAAGRQAGPTSHCSRAAGWELPPRPLVGLSSRGGLHGATAPLLQLLKCSLQEDRLFQNMF